MKGLPFVFLSPAARHAAAAALHAAAVAREHAIKAAFESNPPSDIPGFCVDGFRQLAEGWLKGKELTVFCLESSKASEILFDRFLATPDTSGRSKSQECYDHSLAWGSALAAEAVAAVERINPCESLYPHSLPDRNGYGEDYLSTPNGALDLAGVKLWQVREAFNGYTDSRLDIPQAFNNIAARVERAHEERMNYMVTVSGTLPRMTLI